MSLNILWLLIISTVVVGVPFFFSFVLFSSSVFSCRMVIHVYITCTITFAELESPPPS